MFKKLIKVSMLGACCALFSGCGLISSYKLDKNSPHAKIGFYHNRMFANENAAVIYDDYRQCKNSFNIPMGSTPLEINANGPKTILVNHIIGYTTLHYAFTFRPQINQVYLIKTWSQQLDHNSVATSMQLLKRTTTGRLVPVAIIPRDYQVGTFSNYCTDTRINLKTAKRVKVIRKVAHNVRWVYRKMEN